MWDVNTIQEIKLALNELGKSFETRKDTRQKVFEGQVMSKIAERDRREKLVYEMLELIDEPPPSKDGWVVTQHVEKVEEVMEMSEESDITSSHQSYLDPENYDLSGIVTPQSLYARAFSLFEDQKFLETLKSLSCWFVG